MRIVLLKRVELLNEQLRLQGQLVKRVLSLVVDLEYWSLRQLLNDMSIGLCQWIVLLRLRTLSS